MLITHNPVTYYSILYPIQLSCTITLRMICKLPHLTPKRKHLPIARSPSRLSRKPGPAHSVGDNPRNSDNHTLVTDDSLRHEQRGQFPRPESLNLNNTLALGLGPIEEKICPPPYPATTGDPGTALNPSGWWPGRGRLATGYCKSVATGQ